MNPVTTETVEQALSWRYATKKFDPTKIIAAPEWSALKASLIKAPSSFGLQPWKFIQVSDRALREKIRASAWNQPQVVDASHLVVLAAKASVGADEINTFISAMAKDRGIPEEALKEYKGMMMGFLVPPPPGFNVEDWATRQVYLALGMLLTSSALLGVDACPMEGFVPPQVDEILGLTSTGYSAKVICALGYRSADDKSATAKKVRYAESELIVVK
jgi:nitroreductase